jgi:hypothetical protein
LFITTADAERNCNDYRVFRKIKPDRLLERYIDVKDKVADVEGQHSLSAQVDALKTEAEALRKQVRALEAKEESIPQLTPIPSKKKAQPQ